MSPIPEPTIRVSDRARHARLTLSLRDGLVITIPRRFDRQQIPALLQQKQRWLNRTWQRLESQRPDNTQSPEQRPTTLELHAIDQSWTLHYQPADTVRITTTTDAVQRHLTLTGPIHNATLCRDVLRHWLKQQARRHLPPMLHQLADHAGLTCRRTTIRCQKTRWASCSPTGTISLNIKLLFIPCRLTRYVLLHELTHTIHMNHSPAFWQHLTTLDPDTPNHRTQLRSAWHTLPAWLDQS